MSKARMTGIGGVLGGLISDDRPKAEPGEPARPTPRDKPEKKAHARAGRPPGKSSSKTKRKAKLTVRIDAELIETYREWSWDARCNLGELVGRAMQAYLKNRRNDD